MKFSSSLKFNAVSEWWEEYIDYDGLKKYIYQLEKQQSGLDTNYHDLEASENASLIGGVDNDKNYIRFLDQQLNKTAAFYDHQEKEILRELRELEELIRQQDDSGLSGRDNYLAFDDEDDDDDDEEETEDGEGDASRTPVQTASTASTSRRRQRSVSFSPVAPNSGRDRKLSFDHRHSISSSGGENADLEASLISLQPSHVQSASDGARPRGRARTLFGALRDSVTSSVILPDTIWTSNSDYAWDTRLLFRRRITTLYVSVSSLKSYVELNYSGFRKILKKYDKVTFSELKDRYLHEAVENALPYTQTSKDKLAVALHSLLTLYAKCVTKGDIAEAQRQLKLHQREHIAWERDTVWRQMIGRERRGEDGTPKTIGTDAEVGENRLRLKRRHIWLTIAVVVFVFLLNVQTVKGKEANRCFAILTFATILWATEAIPLFVTSISIPFLLVLLRVIRPQVDDEDFSTSDATKFIFSVMFSPTIMLLIGGFTIASALSKTAIDRILITKVLSLAGTRPSTVLLAFMGVACFASMWISNVAAPTLCFTLIKPILRTLPHKASFGPCLILGIALAANIGGQSSPISSPQNLIAIHAMHPPLDWASWFVVALPVSAISIVLIWLLLLVSYRPSQSPDPTDGYIRIKPIRPTKESFTWKQYWVTFVCLITITLWCIEHEIEDYVGDMGVIAIIPIIAFFSTGVLKKDDFEQFLWTIVFLAMGGIALGEGVKSSGLLEVMDVIIRDLVDGLSLYTMVLVLSAVVLVVSTFISHTIASVLLVPIAQEVGNNFPGNHGRLLIFITGLICSTGMGMPVSGFPNQTAATQEDELGNLYLSNVDFLKNGVPASIIAALVVATVGFLLMKMIGL